MALAVFPMFTSPVIRSFSWMVILGKKGIVNELLVSAGIVSKPISLLYNEFSMVVGFIQLFQDQHLPACGPAPQHSGAGDRKRSGVYRLSHSLHHPPASGWNRYQGACHHDLSAGHVLR